MRNRVVQVVRHVAFEDLGSFAAAFTRAGYDIEYIEAADFDLRLLHPLRADVLVVLGGPIGVGDSEVYPVLGQEIEILARRMAADRPTLGVCLGAQLMAAALGGRVYPSPTKEIGWSPLELSDAGAAGPLCDLLDVPVLHWHGDTFDLPNGCARLASSPLCREQAFARGPNILALQFHAEPVAARAEHWLIGHASELASANIDPAVLRLQARRHGAALELAAGRMLTRWLSGLSDRQSVPAGV